LFLFLFVYLLLFTDELSIEFTRTLLYLNDDFSLENFANLRRASLVALCTTAPAQVAEYTACGPQSLSSSQCFILGRYLGGQFYERNFNLAQRYDMLEVLSLAAKELSSFADENEVEPTAIERESEQQEIEQRMAQAGRLPSQADLIALRIKNNTRRFSRKSEVKQRRTRANPFSAVSAYFFFPLLNHFDRPKLSFALLGEDSLLLERLVQTLAIVMYAAGNAPHFLQMARAFWDFALAIRLASVTGVRRQLLFGLSVVVTLGRRDKLREEFYQDMLETHAWLVGVFHEDPDLECRSLASVVTNTIVDIFKEGHLGLHDLADR